MDIFILEKETHDGRTTIVAAYYDQARAMDGRRGPWRQVDDNTWTTAHRDPLSRWMNPSDTGVTRSWICTVRKTQLIG